MNRREAIRAALAVAREHGIDPRTIKVIEITNCDPNAGELTIGPAASNPFCAAFDGLNSDHVVSRSAKPISLTIEG